MLWFGIQRPRPSCHTSNSSELTADRLAYDSQPNDGCSFVHEEEFRCGRKGAKLPPRACISQIARCMGENQDTGSRPRRVYTAIGYV